MSKVLDNLANLATLVLAGVMVIFLLVRLGVIGTVGGTGTASDRALPYVVGDQVAPLDDMNYGDSNGTLVMVINSKCRVCTETMPFLARIIAERNARRAPLRIVAAAPESDLDAQSYLESHSVRPDALVALPSGHLRIRGTPTLLLVGRLGKLVYILEGKPPQGGEEHVLANIFEEAA